MDSESHQSQPVKELLPTAGVNPELPFDPTIPAQNVDATEANSGINEHKEPTTNGITHLPPISSFGETSSINQEPVAAQPVVLPTLASTTEVREPITAGGLIPQSFDMDPAQHEESDLRHSAGPSEAQLETSQPPVTEAPVSVPVSAPASAPISALLDPEPVPSAPVAQSEAPQEPAPISDTPAMDTDPIPQILTGTDGTQDAMEIDAPQTSPPAPTAVTASPTPVPPVISAPATQEDTSMIDSNTVQPSVETASETVSQQAPSLELQTNVASQPKLSHPRDEEEHDLEPASKRVRADEDLPMTEAKPESSSAIVETPTTMEAPALPSSTSKPAIQTSSRPTSRAGSGQGSRAQSKASTPAPTSATSAYPLPQKGPNGNLIAPPKREHNPEWDQPITAPQKKHLQRGIQNAKKGHHAGPFSNPVDPVVLNIPTYFDIVKKPMDLKTIDTRLKNNDYNSVNEFLADFDVMVENSITFNGPDHAVSQHGIHLRHAIDRNVSGLPSSNFVEPNASEKKAKKIAEAGPPKRRESRTVPTVNAGNARSPTSTQTFALKSDGVPLIRRDSTVQDGRPRREIHPPAPKDLPYSSMKPKRKKFITELKFCDKVYEELMKPKYSNVSWPFLAPVDPVALNIPQYLKIIKKPMDMQTIGQKLKNGEYENAKEFEDDFRLMINNCLKFNPGDHPVHQHGKDYESYFDIEWKGKAKWLKDNTPRSADQSPQSSDEEDEEDEEEEEPEAEEEDDDGQLAKLQETLALVSAQINNLTQKKKKTPPADKKKSKTKSAKKETKKAASSKPSKKATGGGGKKDKTKTISWEDKMSLSDRINDLNQDDMRQAMSIIRKGMPNLSGAEEEELELDIEDLPPHVLYNLHMFVNSKSQKPAPKSTSATHHSNSAASSKPKKNRPMKKEEQEAKIRDLKNQLGRLSGAGGYADADSPGDSSNAIDNDDSSGDDDSEESEED